MKITEKIIGSLVGVSGHTFDLEYDLFFTTERIIAVIIQHPADIPPQFTPTWKTIFFGSGWDTRNEQRLREKIAQARRRTSQDLTPGELATAHSGNFEICYSETTFVKITRRPFQSQLRFYVSRPSTTGQIIRFNLPKKQIPEAWRLLERVLPTKIKVK
jgi:hypothetical protein